MIEVTAMSTDYEADHVVLWLALGICSPALKIRDIVARSDPAPAAAVGDAGTGRFENVVLGLIALAEALDSLRPTEQPLPERPDRAMVPDEAWLR